MVRKFFNYDECSRSQLGPAGIMMGVAKDADKRGGMREDTFHKNTFVIGQIRNPFDWYSSIWAYLSEPYNMRWVPEETRATLSSEMPRGSTWADRKRFRDFVRLYAKPEIGALSLHFWVNYVDLGKTVKELTSPGEHFGELAVLSGRYTRLATVKTVGPTRCGIGGPYQVIRLGPTSSTEGRCFQPLAVVS